MRYAKEGLFKRTSTIFKFCITVFVMKTKQKIGGLILENIFTHREQFEKEKSQICNSEDFKAFELKWFNPKSWERTPFEESLKELQKRESFEKGGYTWYPLGRAYNVPAELLYEYELFSYLDYSGRKEEYRRIGANWEPDDSQFPHMGKECVYDSIYTKNNSPIICPICGRRLFRINITDD
jgi:hypothetical protein